MKIMEIAKPCLLTLIVTGKALQKGKVFKKAQLCFVFKRVSH